MSRVRKAVIGSWVGLMGISAAAPTASASGTASGLLASTVCISPAVLLALVLTPTATLSDAASAAVTRRTKQQ